MFGGFPFLWAHVSSHKRSETCFPDSLAARVTVLSKRDAVCKLQLGNLEKAPHGSLLVRGHRVTQLPDGINVGSSSAGAWAQRQRPQEWGQQCLFLVQFRSRSWFQSHQVGFFAPLEIL